MNDEMQHKGRRLAKTTFVLFAATALAAPVAAWASHQFTDVANSNTFHADIDWMADNGITKGCNPAQGNTKFCPSDFVTRAQMAAFMHRLETEGLLGGGGGGGDADTLDGIDSTGFLAATGKAVNADKLDGIDSTGFLAATGKAVDADKLDGVDIAALRPFDHASGQTQTFVDPANVSVSGATVTITIPSGRTADVLLEFTAESVCRATAGGGSDWCQVEFVQDGTAITNDLAFDSTNGGTETSASWESHTTRHVVEGLTGGSYTFTVRVDHFDSLDDGTVEFRIDDWLLTADAVFTG